MSLLESEGHPGGLESNPLLFKDKNSLGPEASFTGVYFNQPANIRRALLF